MVVAADQRVHALRSRVDTIQTQVAGIVSIDTDARLSALEATIVGNISCVSVTTSGSIYSGSTITASGGAAVICGSLNVQTGPGSGDISCRVVNAAGAVIGGTTNVSDLNITGNVVSNLYMTTGDLTVANGNAITCGSIGVIKTPGSGVVSCYDMNASHIITAAGAVLSGTTNVTDLNVSGNVVSNLYLSTGSLTVANGGAITCGSIGVVKTPGTGVVSCYDMNASHVITGAGAVIGGTTTLTTLVCTTVSASGGVTAASGSAVTCGSINVVASPGSGDIACHDVNATHDLNAGHIITAAGTIITGTANFAFINASSGITASAGSAVQAGSVQTFVGPGSGNITCGGTFVGSSFSTNPAYTAPAALSGGASLATVIATVNVLIDRLGPAKLHLLN